MSLEIAALGGLLSLLFAPASAQAFCRTTTCNNYQRQCQTDPGTGCVNEGIPIAWKRPCVSFSLDTSNLDPTRVSATLDLVNRAFRAWSETKCGAASDQPSSISLRHAWGPVLCSHIEYNKHQGNANVITFRDLWPYEDEGSELGRTTVTYRTDTGELLDADIEINNDQPFSTETPVPEGGYDLQSILTHEAGHFIGLAHPPLASSAETVMTTYYTPGTDYRTLRADDVSALCTVYPPDPNSFPICDYVPINGFSAECALDPEIGGACSAPGAKAARGGLTAALLAAAAATLLRWRRRVQS